MLNELDFKEPPRIVLVPFSVFQMFCEQSESHHLRLLWWEPKLELNEYRVSLSKPIPDSLKEFMLEDSSSLLTSKSSKPKNPT